MELKDIIAQQQALAQQQAGMVAPAGQGLSALTQGVSMAGQGASLGSSFGPIGTAIGAGVGLLGGAAMGVIQSKKQEKEFNTAQSQLQAQSSILDNQKINLQNSTSSEFKMGGQLTRFEGEGHNKGGIKIGKDEVEGGETMMDDYIFSNYLSPKDSNKTFAELSKKIDDEYFRKNDKFSEASKQARYNALREQQDEINSKFEKAEDVPKQFRCGGSRSVGKDVMSRKYIMGGSLGKKYELGSNTSDKPLFNFFDQQAMPPNVGAEWKDSVEPNPLLASNALNITNLPNVTPSASNFNFESEALGNKAFVPEFDVRGNLVDSSPRISGEGVNSFLGNVGSTATQLAPSLLQSLPGLIGAATNYGISKDVKYGRVSPQTVDANLLDPTRALQETGTAFAGGNQALGNLQGGQYLSNRIASAAAEANARAGVNQKYDEANAQILNSTDLSNASARNQANLVNLQQSTQETQDKLQAIGQTGQELSKATSAALGAYNTNVRDAKMLPFLGTENYPVYMDKNGNPTLDFESSRDGINYNQNIIGKSKTKK